MRTTTELPATADQYRGAGVPAHRRVTRRHALRASGALVMVGDPGVGKTALCGWAMGAAADMRLLVVRGVESEVDLPTRVWRSCALGRIWSGDCWHRRRGGATYCTSLTRVNTDGSLDRSFTVCLREPHRTRFIGSTTGTASWGAVLFPRTATHI